MGSSPTWDHCFFHCSLSYHLRWSWVKIHSRSALCACVCVLFKYNVLVLGCSFSVETLPCFQKKVEPVMVIRASSHLRPAIWNQPAEDLMSQPCCHVCGQFSMTAVVENGVWFLDRGLTALCEQDPAFSISLSATVETERFSQWDCSAV